MENLHKIMETLSGWVWGPYMLVLIVGTGVFLYLPFIILAVPYVAFGL